MKEKLIQYLVCPSCAATIRISSIVAREQAEIIEGTLNCQSCDHTWPIVRGVPRFAAINEVAQDKATLMGSMLKSMGVDSYHVVINTRRGSVTPDMPAHMGGFNHAIMAIKLPDGVLDPSLVAMVPLLLTPDVESVPILIGPWLILALGWLAWPVVLIRHPGRSALRTVLPLVISLVLLSPYILQPPPCASGRGAGCYQAFTVGTFVVAIIVALAGLIFAFLELRRAPRG